jgi:hypothetical protein
MMARLKNLNADARVNSLTQCGTPLANKSLMSIRMKRHSLAPNSVQNSLQKSIKRLRPSGSFNPGAVSLSNSAPIEFAEITLELDKTVSLLSPVHETAMAISLSPERALKSHLSLILSPVHETAMAVSHSPERALKSHLSSSISSENAFVLSPVDFLSVLESLDLNKITRTYSAVLTSIEMVMTDSAINPEAQKILKEVVMNILKVHYLDFLIFFIMF